MYISLFCKKQNPHVFIEKTFQNMFLNYKALLILIDNHKGSIVNRSVIYGRQKCLNVENVHLHFCTHILDENLYIQKLYMQSQDGHHCLLFYHRQFVLIKYWRKFLWIAIWQIVWWCWYHKKNNWVYDVKHCLIDESFKIIWNLQRYNDVIK